MTITTLSQAPDSLTTWESAYCFAHQGRATMTVTTFAADGQEKVTCDHCGAEGYGPAVNGVQVLEVRVRDLRQGDVILTSTGYQNEVVGPVRILGGTGKASFRLHRQDRDDWDGRLPLLDTVKVARRPR